MLRTNKRTIKKTIKNSYSRKKTNKYRNIQKQNGGNILNTFSKAIYKPETGKTLKLIFLVKN